MNEIKHLNQEQLEAELETIRQSPKSDGVLEMIVRRPDIGKREVLQTGELDLDVGLVGDNWKARPSSRMADRSAHPDMQINIMNSRTIALIAQSRERWQLAGDQLYVDLDLSKDNLPAGTQLAIGTAILEITDQPHTGCKKFVARFGMDAVKWVNSDMGKRLRLRGLNAKVVQAGAIKQGDTVTKLQIVTPI